MPPCPICSQLKDIETSFHKFASPDYDRPLPEAATQLTKVITPDMIDPEKNHVRCCPLCGALYSYRMTYEYYINGGEDEEELVCLQPAEMVTFLRNQALQLEALRQEIDRLESTAGRLGDYLDRGHPTPAETETMFNEMKENRQSAREVRLQLQSRVENLRQTCPGILHQWVEVHSQVCRQFINSLPQAGEEAETALFVARSTLEAWEQLPLEGETFISISENWLSGYLDLLDVSGLHVK